MKKPALLRIPRDTRREVMHMAAPVLLEQFIICSMGMVGMILASRLGKDAVSPIGMVDALHNIFIMFFTSLGAGATVMVAQSTGRGDLVYANEAARQAMVTSVLISAVMVVILQFTGVPLVELLYRKQPADIAAGIPLYLYPSLYSYPMLAIVTVGCGVLRGTGDMRTPMFITIIMGVLNAALSALFIYGLHWSRWGINISGFGLEGAGLALLVSRGVAAALILFVLLRGQRAVKMQFRGFRFVPIMQKELMAIGVPVTLESALFQVGKLLTTMVVASSGPVHMAATVIGNSILTLVCIPGNAFSIAAMPIVGQSVGRREYDDARDKLLFVNWCSSLMLGVTCLALFLFSGPLVSLYTTEHDVAAVTIGMVNVICIFMPPFWSGSFVLSNGLKGAGDTIYSLLTSIIGMWLFRVLLGYYLGSTLQMGAVGVFLGMCVDWVVRGALYYIRLRGKRWFRRAESLAIAAEQAQAT